MLRYIIHMNLLSRIARIVGRVFVGPAPRRADGDVATIDSWLAEDQFLAGLPAQWNEFGGWRWWHGQ